jgi:fucose permease
MMVLAIFLYVGAEVCVSSGAPLYLKDRFGVDINKVGLLGTGLFFLALTIGRFSGGVILNWLKPKVFFAITCVLSVVGLLGLFIPSGTVAGISFFVVGLGFANIFPLVFSITIDRMPEHTNALSGLMVMAIVGGAIVPPLMGWLADAAGSVQTGFFVPLVAILYILWVAIWNSLKIRASY